jgi:hypothetical protein
MSYIAPALGGWRSKGMETNVAYHTSGWSALPLLVFLFSSLRLRSLKNVAVVFALLNRPYPSGTIISGLCRSKSDLDASIAWTGHCNVSGL